jgi:hypothetical protein
MQTPGPSVIRNSFMGNPLYYLDINNYFLPYPNTIALYPIPG